MEDVINYFNGEMRYFRLLGWLGEWIHCIYFCKLLYDNVEVHYSPFNFVNA